MRKPLEWTLSLSLAVLGPVTLAAATPTVSVGTINLEPNKPGQIVEIYVTGGDQVRYLEFFAQVANGGPELERSSQDYAIPAGTGIPGPAITAVDLLTDTIFSGGNYGQLNPGDGDVELPQAVAAYIAASNGSVAADGLLARLTIDTSGFASGTFALSLTAYGVTTLFDVDASVTDGILVVGSGEDADPNERPIVDAGADRAVTAGDLVQLVGTATDPEGRAISYEWRQTDGPAVVLSNANSATASFTAPTGLVNARLTFTLSVSDGVSTGTDSVLITVNNEASLLTVDAGVDKTYPAGALVELAAAASPGPLTNLTYTWTQVGGPTVALAASGTSGVSFVGPVDLVNTVITLEVRVSDGIHEVVDTVNVTIEANTAKPTADAGQDQAVAAGATVQLDGSGTDPDGFGLAYLWTQIAGADVQLSDATSADPTFTAPSESTASVLEFELRVSSGTSTSSDTVVVHVAAAAGQTVDPGNDTSGTTSGNTEETTSETTTSDYASQWADWFDSALVGIGLWMLVFALILLFLFLL